MQALSQLSYTPSKRRRNYTGGGHHCQSTLAKTQPEVKSSLLAGLQCTSVVTEQSAGEPLIELFRHIQEFGNDLDAVLLRLQFLDHYRQMQSLGQTQIQVKIDHHPFDP